MRHGQVEHSHRDRIAQTPLIPPLPYSEYQCRRRVAYRSYTRPVNPSILWFALMKSASNWSKKLEFPPSNRVLLNTTTMNMSNGVCNLFMLSEPLAG